MYVYADVLGILNLFMNAVILCGTCKVSGVPPRWIRIGCSALLGALASLLMFFPAGMFLRWPLGKIILSILMVGIVFYPAPWRRWALIFSSFYLISFLLGGLVLALLYFSDASTYLTDGVFTIQHVSWMTLLSGAVLLVLWGHWVWGRFSARLWQKNCYLPVRIFMSGQQVQVPALIDSGNCLRDPLSHMPVTIMEYESVKPLLPPGVRSLLDAAAEENWLETLQHWPQEWVTRLHIIPFSSLGLKRGVLIGFRPDYLEIESAGDVNKVTAVIVGMCSGKLSSLGDYHALLHPELLHRADKQKKEAS